MIYFCQISTSVIFLNYIYISILKSTIGLEIESLSGLNQSMIKDLKSATTFYELKCKPGKEWGYIWLFVCVHPIFFLRVAISSDTSVLALSSWFSLCSRVVTRFELGTGCTWTLTGCCRLLPPTSPLAVGGLNSYASTIFSLRRSCLLLLSSSSSSFFFFLWYRL